ncbi:hypothetical protein Tco_1277929 [Tanacetum coccineum]
MKGRLSRKNDSGCATYYKCHSRFDRDSVAAIPVDRKEGSPDVCVIELGGTIDSRRLIDKEMERFKISEKEKKTQASCKERLEQPPKKLVYDERAYNKDVEEEEIKDSCNDGLNKGFYRSIMDYVDKNKGWMFFASPGEQELFVTGAMIRVISLAKDAIRYLSTYMQIRPDRQTLYWSATWPKEVELLSKHLLYNPYKVVIGSSDLKANHSIHQHVEIMTENQKYNNLGLLKWNVDIDHLTICQTNIPKIASCTMIRKIGDKNRSGNLLSKIFLRIEWTSITHYSKRNNKFGLLLRKMTIVVLITLRVENYCLNVSCFCREIIMFSNSTVIDEESCGGDFAVD